MEQGDKNTIGKKQWRPITQVLMSVALIILLTGGAYWLGNLSRKTIDSNGGLIIEDARLDFGEVWETDQFSWTIPIRNEGKDNVEVQRFQSSCSCVAIEPASFRLRSGEASEIHLVFDLSRSERGQHEKAVRDFEVHLSPQITGGMASERGWRIKGRVRSPFELTPQIVYFWEGLVQGQPHKSERVILKSHVPLQSVRIKDAPIGASVKVRKLMESRSEYELMVGLTDSVPAGPFTFTFSVQGVGLDSHPLPAKKMVLKGVVYSDIQLMPEKLALGPKAIGEKMEETIVIHSIAGKSFTLAGIEGGEDVTFITQEQHKELGMAVRMRYECKRIGLHTQRILFSVQPQGQSSVEKIPFEVSCYGLANSQDK